MSKKTSVSTQELDELSFTGQVAGEARNARTILEYAHDTANSLLAAYVTVRETRDATAGTSTDQEQDLLRAMLVMAAAGLDGMAKQLIRDTMSSVVSKDPSAKEGLETFVARQIRGAPDTPETVIGFKFLARLITAACQQKQAIEEYIRELTGGSLQSADELIRIGNAFGLKPEEIGIDDKRKMQNVFDIRNMIIHELDMDLTGRQRKRVQRKLADMKDNANLLFGIGCRLLTEVNKKLAHPAT